MHLKERYMQGGEFLSTPSARRATLTLAVHFLSQINFYPRPPRGGRRGMPDNYKGPAQFLSTPSARRATENAKADMDATAISIHALREEGDAFRPPFWFACPNFYPRPPRGGRRLPRRERYPAQRHFYPRPPRGGRLFCIHESPINTQFLSTPSARRATSSRLQRQGASGNFYPRPPRGGRPAAHLST